MVVVHEQQDEEQHDHAAQHRRRQGPFVERDLEELEDDPADRAVDREQQDFHQPGPSLAVLDRGLSGSSMAGPRCRLLDLGNTRFEPRDRRLQFGRRLAVGRAGKAPAAFRAIGHRPDPQERPKRVQGEEAHPSGRMDRVLMRMLAPLGDFVGYIVDRDHGVEQRDDDEEQQAEREIVEEHFRPPTAGVSA